MAKKRKSAGYQGGQAAREKWVTQTEQTLVVLGETEEGSHAREREAKKVRKRLIAGRNGIRKALRDDPNIDPLAEHDLEYIETSLRMVASIVKENARAIRMAKADDARTKREVEKKLDNLFEGQSEQEWQQEREHLRRMVDSGEMDVDDESSLRQELEDDLARFRAAETDPDLKDITRVHTQLREVEELHKAADHAVTQRDGNTNQKGSIVHVALAAESDNPGVSVRDDIMSDPDGGGIEILPGTPMGMASPRKVNVGSRKRKAAPAWENKHEAKTRSRRSSSKPRRRRRRSA